MPHHRLIAYRLKTGEGAYGAVYADEVVCERGAIDDKRRLVRGSDGAEAVSSARVALDLPDHPMLTEGTLVTIWKGRANERTAEVRFTEIADFPRLPHFQQVTLT